MPTKSVFSVESSVRSSKVKESNEDEEFQRQGTSAICIQWVIYLKLMFLRLAFLFRSSPVPAGSRWKSALYWLCGMKRRTDGDDDPAPPEENACSLEEEPHLKHIVNVNLIICLCGAAFIIGYWA